MSVWDTYASSTSDSREPRSLGLQTGRCRWSAGCWGGATRLAISRMPRGTVARFQNIAVSRETGAGGGTISRMVGQKLGWKVYDHELLEAIAQPDGASRRRRPGLRRAGPKHACKTGSCPCAKSTMLLRKRILIILPS